MGMRSLGHRSDVLLAVADSRQERRHHHTSIDPVFHQELHRFQSGLGSGSARLSQLPDLVVHRADAEVDADLCDLTELSQHIDVPPDQHALGGDGRGVAEIDQHLQDAACQFVLGLGWLVWIGRGADGD